MALWWAGCMLGSALVAVSPLMGLRVASSSWARAEEKWWRVDLKLRSGSMFMMDSRTEPLYSSLTSVMMLEGKWRYTRGFTAYSGPELDFLGCSASRTLSFLGVCSFSAGFSSFCGGLGSAPRAPSSYSRTSLSSGSWLRLRMSPAMSGGCRSALISVVAKLPLCLSTSQWCAVLSRAVLRARWVWESSLSRMRLSTVFRKPLLLIDRTSTELRCCSRAVPRKPLPRRKSSTCLESLVASATLPRRYSAEGRSSPSSTRSTSLLFFLATPSTNRRALSLVLVRTRLRSLPLKACLAYRSRRPWMATAPSTLSTDSTADSQLSEPARPPSLQRPTWKQSRVQGVVVGGGCGESRRAAGDLEREWTAVSLILAGEGEWAGRWRLVRGVEGQLGIIYYKRSPQRTNRQSDVVEEGGAQAAERSAAQQGR